MREQEFKNWLEVQGYSHKPISDALSRCRRIVKHYNICLDVEFAKDRLEGIISMFVYTAADKKARQAPKHTIPINGDIYNGTSSLKNALTLYLKFCDGTK